jgi:hypothetical protein
VLDLAKQNPRRGGGVKAAFDPVEQGELQLIFGMKQDLTHRRLGNVEQAGGSADASGFHDRSENFNLAEFHLVTLPGQPCSDGRSRRQDNNENGRTISNCQARLAPVSRLTISLAASESAKGMKQ